MKYGKELSRRSVPEWRAYNLDYNEIKELIKKATVPNASSDEFSSVFEALKTQYDAIGLFVKSKTGEIERRVRHCEKIINSIAEKDEQRLQQKQLQIPVSPQLAPASAESSKSTLSRDKSRQQLVFLLRQEIVQLTRDVQRLARFIGVQRTGFRKLLKKYKKWSESSELSDLFLPILEAPTSFTNQDFTSIFLELSLLYNVLRQARSSNYISRTAPSQYSTNETLVKFDCEMVTAISSSSIFWIHPDNVVEIKVALLKNLGLVSDDSAAASLSRSPSSTSITNIASSSPKSSNSNNETTESNTSTDNNLGDLSYSIYLDNPKKFNSIQTHSEPGQIRWVHGGELASPPQDPSNSSHVLCSPVGGLRYFCLASLTPSQSDLILHSQFDGLTKETASEKNNLAKLALSWVAKRKAAPISKASFIRSRFRYINTKSSLTASNANPQLQASQSESSLFSTSPTSSMNNSDIWATLDTNIRIAKPKDGTSFDCGQITDDSESQDFPYAVLEIRYKGMDKPAWLAELENSHLVYPVQGFSLYAHSVATFYAKALSQLPSWLSVLESESDIRRTPKRNHNNNSTNSSNNNNGGINITVNGPASGILLNSYNSSTEREPLLRNNSNGPRYTQDVVSDKQLPTSLETNQPVVRYWNEFDDPEDGHDDGVFVIIPDDDDEQGGVFSDQNVATLVNLSDNFVKKAHKLKHKVAQIFGISLSHSDADGDTDSYDSYDSSDDYYYYHNRGLPTIYEEDEEADHGPDSRNKHRHHDDEEADLDYYSFPGVYPYQEYSLAEQRDYILTVLYTLFISLALLIVVILFGFILGNDMTAVSSGMLAAIYSGLSISLLIGTLAIYLFSSRSTFPGPVHQSLVYLLFFIVMSLSVGGIMWLIV